MPLPEEQHFSRVWYLLVLGAIIVSLPLDLLGWWPAWAVHAHLLGGILFGVFLGAEFSAGGSVPGTAGTMTNWTYRKIGQQLWRILFGVWLAALLAWRVDLWLGILFLAWLPIHFTREGKPGPMDKLVHWIGLRFGLNIRTY